MIFDFGKVKLRDELIAALTIFLASSYILFINPQMLRDAGMDFDGAFFATTMAAALGTLLVGLIANKPYIIAPGMTLNVFFTYTLVKTYGISWQAALAASLVVGVILLALSLSKVRVWFVEAIPMGLRYGILGGIGLLLVFVGFTRAHLIVPSQFTYITMGDVFSPAALIAIFGFLITGLLFIRKVNGAFLFGILLTTLLALMLSYMGGAPVAIGFCEFPRNLGEVAFKFNLTELFSMGTLSVSIILGLFIVAFFDTIGTTTALLIQGKHADNEGNLKGLDKVMISDSLATIFGAALGSSPQVVYAESASAYESGGRTGLTAVFVTIFFALSLFFLPLIKLVPVEATAPVLIIVGLLMLGGIRRLDVRDYSESVPALFCLAAIPLTFSVSHGIGLAVIMYVLLKLFAGRMKEIHAGMWITALLFLFDFLGLF